MTKGNGDEVAAFIKGGLGGYMKPRAIAVMAVLVTALFVAAESQKPRAEDDVALLKQALSLFKPLPQTLGTQDLPTTPARMALGRMLFFDPRWTVDGNVSCATCHQPALYGTDALSPGISRRGPADHVGEHREGDRCLRTHASQPGALRCLFARECAGVAADGQGRPRAVHEPRLSCVPQRGRYWWPDVPEVRADGRVLESDRKSGDRQGPLRTHEGSRRPVRVQSPESPKRRHDPTLFSRWVGGHARRSGAGDGPRATGCHAARRRGQRDRGVPPLTHWASPREF